MNFKFYNDTDTDNLIGMVPFFINGTDFNHDDSAKPYLTNDINEAEYFCTHIDSVGPQRFIEALNIILKIRKSRDVTWIIECKDEIITISEWDIIKSFRDKFPRNKLLLLSAELKKEVSDDIIESFPNYLIPYQYLHHNRSLIPFSFLELPEESIPSKTKKILSSARKYNPCRDSFYKIFLKNEGESKYMNEFNEFRYFGLTAKENLAETETTKYFKQNYHTNHDFKKIKSDRMMWSEGEYYHELLEEYSNYFFSIVHETAPKDTFSDNPPRFLPDNLYPNNRFGLQMGEKTMLPMTSKGIFFVNSYSGIEKYLQKIGIETFSDIFNINYDEFSIDRRSKKMLEVVDIINNMSITDITNLYNREDIQEKIQKNYNYIIYHRNKDNCRKDHFEYLKKLL